MPLEVDVAGCAWNQWVCDKCKIARFEDESTATNHEIHCGEALFHNQELLVPELIHENIAKLHLGDLSLKALKISRGNIAELEKAMEVFIRFVRRGQYYIEDIDGYTDLGKCIAELNSVEVFVIADEEDFDRDGYISGFYEEISASKSIKHFQYSNCEMMDDYGLCALPTDSLVSIKLINCKLSDNCITDGFSHCEKLNRIEFQNCDFVDGKDGVSQLIDEFNENDLLAVIFSGCKYFKDGKQSSFEYSKKPID